MPAGRTQADLNPEERQLHDNLKSVIANDLMSKEEVERAKVQLDALLWKGRQGNVYAELKKFDDRLSNIELIKKGGKGVATKKEIADVKKLIADGDVAIKAALLGIEEMEKSNAERQLELTRLNADYAKLLTAHETVLEEIKKLSRQRQEMMHKQAQVNDELKGADGKILKALADILTDVQDEAKTAVEAEARLAVEAYMKDNYPAEKTT